MFRLIISLILLSLSVGGFFIFIKPSYEEMQILKQKAASYNSALDNAKALENERDKLTARYNAIDPENIKKLEKFLPDNVDNIRLILELEKVALPYGMTIRNIQYEVEDASQKSKTTVPGGTEGDSQRKEYGIWNFRFSTQGGYNNFLSFVKDLENNLRIVDISSIKFSSNEGIGANPGSTESYKYDFSIKTYWLKN